MRRFPGFRVLIFLTVFLFSGEASGGTNPAAYLEKGVGARAMGMGGAFVAIAGDPSSGYWNPAGLAPIDHLQISGMFQHTGSSDWPGLSDITPGYRFFSAAAPLRMTGLISHGAASVSIVSMNIDNIPLTELDDSGAVVRKDFSNRESAVILSAGYPFLENNVLIGGSVRYLRQDFSGISGASASGWDIQVGKIFYATEQLSLGFTIERGPTLKWESGHRDSGEVKTKLGMSYSRMLTWSIDMLGAAELIQKKNMPLQASMGVEVSYDLGLENIPEVFARTGVNRLTVEDRYGYRSRLNQNIRWSAGLGANFRYLDYALRADYAFVNEAIGNDHLISVTLSF